VEVSRAHRKLRKRVKLASFNLSKTARIKVMVEPYMLIFPMPVGKLTSDAESLFLQELSAIDPRLRAVYSALYKHFYGDASARQVSIYLQSKGIAWAKVHRTTMGRWIGQVNRMLADHRSSLHVLLLALGYGCGFALESDVSILASF
jgi:hypothetical protein